MSDSDTALVKRDARGRLLPGSILNPRGRATRTREQIYLDEMTAIVGLDDWRDVVVAQLEKAKAGNLQSAKWLASYLLGLPVQRLQAELGTVDVDPRQRRQNVTRLATILMAVITETEIGDIDGIDVVDGEVGEVGE